MKALVGAFLVILLVQSPVFAQEDQTTVFYPIEDSYVNLMASAANYGGSQTLEAEWSAVQAMDGSYKMQIDRLSYLKFDLSISEDSIIRSAILKLYVTDAPKAPSSLIALPQKDNAWNETTLTPKNAPDVPSSQKNLEDTGLDEAEITELETWYSLDVTPHARSVRYGQISFIVAGGATDDPWEGIIQFNSRESADQALRPYLELTYLGSQTQTETESTSETEEPQEEVRPTVVYLTLRSSVSGGYVYFNGTEYEVPNSREVILDVPTGSFEIEASPVVSISERARAVFQKWNDSSRDNPRQIEVTKSVTFTAQYLEEYYVNVTSQYGVADGTGWYRSGSTANAKVSGDPGANSPRVQAEGMLGLLGVYYVFDQWSGYPASSSSLPIAVKSPVTVTALWKQDYSLLYSNLIRAALSLGAGFTAAIFVKRRLSKTKQPVDIRGERQRVGPIGPMGRFRPRLPTVSKTTVTGNPGVHMRTAKAGLPSVSGSSVAPGNPGPSMRRAEPPRTLSIAQRPPRASTTVTGNPVAYKQELEPQRTVVIPRSEPLDASETKFCRECGATIPEDSKFCEECGKKLAWKQPMPDYGGESAAFGSTTGALAALRPQIEGVILQTKKRCPACEMEGPYTAKFCVNCGVKFEKSCPTCHKESPYTAKFCVSCGARFGTRQGRDAAVQTEGTRPTRGRDSPDITGARARKIETRSEAPSSLPRYAHRKRK